MTVSFHTSPSSTEPGPGHAFAELSRIVHGEGTLSDVLLRVARLSRDVVPGLLDVSVTLIEKDRPTTVVFTGPLAVHLDERQYELGFGPCTDAAESGGTIVVDTARRDDSYAAFAAVAAEHGVTHVLSVGLPVPNHIVGALNMYSGQPDPIASESVALAEAFAGYAAVAVANAASYHASVDLVRNLKAAMASRAVIEQAKGILMAREKCTSEEAFDLLARLSQNRNHRLRDLAAQLVAQTGSGPGPSAG
jgi:GAF domain-containing protein